MKLNHYSHELPFVYPFTISKGTKTHQPTLVVELAWRGLKGYGEAPAINYYEITVESMIKDLEAKRTVLEKFALTDPERYWHFLHHLFPRNPLLVGTYGAKWLENHCINFGSWIPPKHRLLTIPSE
jgi:L-alanine-DL-glutamate epimerase-like enolase superfamily enzyme